MGWSWKTAKISTIACFGTVVMCTQMIFWTQIPWSGMSESDFDSEFRIWFDSGRRQWKEIVRRGQDSVMLQKRSQCVHHLGTFWGDRGWFGGVLEWFGHAKSVSVIGCTRVPKIRLEFSVRLAGLDSRNPQDSFRDDPFLLHNASFSNIPLPKI